MKKSNIILSQMGKMAFLMTALSFFIVPQVNGQNTTDESDTISIQLQKASVIQIQSAASKQNVAVIVPAEKKAAIFEKAKTEVDIQKILLIKSDTISKNELLAIPEIDMKTKVEEE